MIVAILLKKSPPRAGFFFGLKNQLRLIAINCLESPLEPNRPHTIQCKAGLQ